MEQVRIWTPELDARLLTLRAAGLAWDMIGQELRLGRTATRERGRRLGARRLPRQRPVHETEFGERPPYPPGHPACWGLITAGTVLEGEAYPYPVFL
jgi:hypothetical protein